MQLAELIISSAGDKLREVTQTLGPWLEHSSAIVASILPEHLGTAPGREQFGQTVGQHGSRQTDSPRGSQEGRAVDGSPNLKHAR